MFENLGLDSRLETVYRALLLNPEWGSADVARYLVMPEQEIRDLLDRLVELSLLRPSEAGQVLPVNPEFALPALLHRHEEELLERRQRIELTRAAISAIGEEYRAARSREERLERLDGVEAVRLRLEEFAHDARFECLSFQPGGAKSRDAMEASKELDVLAIERGVSIRSVYRESIRNDRATLEYVSWLAGIGAESRTSPTLPLQLVIIDRRVAFVPLSPENARLGAVQLDSPGVVSALLALFELVWSAAVPIGENPTKDDDGLSPEERALLRLLLQGCTDEGAARRLGVSLRTVRRRMSVLLDRLDAKSRFQAGAYAAQRGWV
ncbi:LuxR C-terminal-related transcriptional regulator [Actinomadura sp. 9N215]|uniref:LuxR C-terminal-related transcriptional regulator n=1 Tax=Actinomadura sp. 9N215 TaxID=3375150 RepID=UPI00379B152E